MRCIAPSGASTSRKARSAASGSVVWCSTPVQMTSSNVMPSSPTRSIGNRRTSRLASPYLCFSASVCRTLVALKSIPITCAAGARSGVLGRLRGAAAGDEDRALFGVWLVRLEEMKVSATPARVLPAPPVVVEIIDRPRVRVTFVEVLDRGRDVIAGSRVR